MPKQFPTTQTTAKGRSNRFGRILRGFLTDRQATSIVEFGLVVPVFLLVLGGTIDFGMVVGTKYKLSSGMSAASNYAISYVVSAGTIGSSNAATLSSSVANIVASANGTNWATVTATVNNGATSTNANSTTITTSGTASLADSCYCPTAGATGASFWGSAVTCGSACSGGGYAGKFVQITTSRCFTPMLLPVSMFTSTPAATCVPLVATSVAQLQ